MLHELTGFDVTAARGNLASDVSTEITEIDFLIRVPIQIKFDRKTIVTIMRKTVFIAMNSLMS